MTIRQKLTVLTGKDYARLFGVCLRTAYRMLNEDKEEFGVKRITLAKFASKYGLDDRDQKMILAA